MLSILQATLRSVAISFGSALISKVFVKWLILWAGEIMVKKTSTPHDDEFFAKLKEVLGD